MADRDDERVPTQNKAVAALSRPGHLWKTGQSGNPGGRPKAALRVRDLARTHTETALKTLVDCLTSGDERVRVAAATAILDRAWGKPIAAVAEPEETQPNELASLSEDELKAIIAAEQRPS